MYFKSLKVILPFAAALAIAVSCAKISAPTGGPRDKEPPFTVESKPVAGALNFQGRSVEITFNEYIALDNINDKFMVSPPVRKKPQIYVRGKSIMVDFEEDLADSTTYTLYFQDAIKDINESNILNDFQFVFSTGPVLDSLSVTGNAYEAYTLEVPDKALILLYNNLADSAVMKTLPAYISGIDRNGYFTISNVAPGKYRLYALVDEDNSKNYNLESEKFAFLDSVIAVTPEKNYIPPQKDSVIVNKVTGKKTEVPLKTGTYSLYLFQAARKNHYLASSNREMKYKLNYVLSLPPDTMKFSFSIAESAGEGYYIERSMNKDSIRVWISDSTLYELPRLTTLITYPFTDTLGITGYKKDTVIMRYTAPRPARNLKVKRTPFTFNSTISAGNLKPGQKIAFDALTPFRAPDTSRIRLYEVADSVRKRLAFSLSADSMNSCRYTMNASLRQGKQYLLIADSESFGNIFGEYSDSTGIRFSIKDPESYNKLSLDISGFSGKRIVQLLKSDEKPAGEIISDKDGKVLFPLLDVGKYRVRLIYDLNGDGKWTTGEFSLYRQPEPVTYYFQEIDLKSGWNADNAWDVSIRNSKDPLLRKSKTDAR